MDLKICWLYHDIMDLYGDKGNMLVLRKRCEDRGKSGHNRHFKHRSGM